MQEEFDHGQDDSSVGGDLVAAGVLAADDTEKIKTFGAYVDLILRPPDAGPIVDSRSNVAEDFQKGSSPVLLRVDDNFVFR